MPPSYLSSPSSCGPPARLLLRLSRYLCSVARTAHGLCFVTGRLLGLCPSQLTSRALGLPFTKLPPRNWPGRCCSRRRLINRMFCGLSTSCMPLRTPAVLRWRRAWLGLAVTRTCPAVCQLLACGMRHFAPGVAYTSLAVFADFLSPEHTDAHNDHSFYNVIVPLSSFSGGECVFVT